MDRRDSTSAAGQPDSAGSSVTPQGPLSPGQKGRRHQQPKSINPVLLTKALGVSIASIITMALLVVLLGATKTTFTVYDCLACREADEHLQRAADPEVSPCDDFYRHVCGRFDNSVNGSFEDLVIREGRRRLRGALIRYPSGTRKTSWTFELLSSYYKSCVEDLRNPNNLSYVSVKYAEATGFSWTLFESVNSVPTFLDLVAKMSVEFTLHPGIWIHPVRSMLLMGPLSLPSFLSMAEMRSILTTAKASLLLQSLTTHVMFEVEGLHMRLRSKAEQSQQDTPSSSGSSADLLPQLELGTAKEWVEAIAKHSVRPLNISVSTEAWIIGPEAFKYVIKTIYNRTPVVRSIYLYVYVIREVIRYVNISIEAGGDPGVVSNVCLDKLEITELYAMHRAFAVYSLATERTIASVRDILAHAAYQVVATIRANRRLEASAKISLAQTLRSYSFVNAFSEPFLDLEQLDSIYEAFPENLTIYHDKLNLPAALPMGTLVEFHRLASCLKPRSRLLNYDGDLCVSPYILVPPMYYPDARLSYNYAVLGFLMTSHAIRDLLLTRPLQDPDAVQALLRESTKCYSKAENVSGDEEATDMVAYVLGLRSTLGAYARWRKYGLYKAGAAEDLQVFFERACFSVCAGTASNDSVVWGSARTCKAAVRNMPEFHSLFRCTPFSNMSRNGICRFF